MRTVVKTIFFILAIVFGISLQLIQSQNLEVFISGLRSSKGQIVLSAFKDDPAFQAEKPYKSFCFSKKEMEQGKIKVSLELPSGSYGISLLDDENNDNKMNYNFIGMPLEGFGFSNFYLSGFVRPHLDDFIFKIETGKKQKVFIKVRYV